MFPTRVNPRPGDDGGEGLRESAVPAVRLSRICPIRSLRLAGIRWFRTFAPPSTLVLVAGLLALVGARGAETRFETMAFYADADAARVVSGVDLFSTATRLWEAGVRTNLPTLEVRGVLDKRSYRLGEPIHLFVYTRATASSGAVCPKASHWEIVRPYGADSSGHVLPTTPVGAWLQSLPAPESMGLRRLGPDRVAVSHLDLTDVFELGQPGTYSIVTKALYFTIGNGHLPTNATLPVLRFTVTAERFPEPVRRPPSELQLAHQDSVNRAAGRVRELTPLEHRMVHENEEQMRAMLAADAVRLRSNPPALPAAPVTPPKGSVPFPMPSPDRGNGPAERAAADTRRFLGWTAAGLGAFAVLAAGVRAWTWRRVR